MLKFYCIKQLKLEVEDERDQLLQNLKRIAEDLNNEISLVNFKYDWAKICLCLLDEGINPEDGTTDNLELAFYIDEFFLEMGSYKLRLATLKLICNMLIKHDSAKCLEYARKGADLAKELSEKSVQGRMGQFERLFGEIIDSLTEEMEYRIHNKFVFLECNPLTRSAKKIDHLVHTKKSLRSAIIDKISTLHKKLVLEFDVLTDKRFFELFSPDNGCKLLVIDFAHPADPSGLVLEDNSLGEKLFTLDMIYDMAEVQENWMSVDILIIMNSQGKDYVTYFDHSNVKMIIYFDLPNNSNSSSEYELFERYWSEEFKYCFLNKFIDEFSQNKYAINCIQQAKIEAVESMTHRVETETTLYHTIKNSWQEESVKIENPQIVPSFDKFLINYQDYNSHGSTIRCNLANSDLIEESNQTQSEPNIPPIYLRRDKQLLELVTMLKKHSCICMTGQMGVGKTFLIRLLVNMVEIRNMYPDGVFVYELKNLGTTDSIRSSMKEKMGDDYYTNTQNFFKDKKMLIIFDSYERVLRKELMDPRHLLESLKASNIPTIFIIRSSGSQGLLMQDVETYKVEPLNGQESLLLLLSLQAREKTFFRFSDGSIEKLISSDIILKSKGIPSSLITQCSKFFHNEMDVEYAMKKHKTITHSSPIGSPAGDFDRLGSLLDCLSEDRSMNDSMTHSKNAKASTSSVRNVSKYDSKKDYKHSKHKMKNKKKKDMN